VKVVRKKGKVIGRAIVMIITMAKVRLPVTTPQTNPHPMTASRKAVTKKGQLLMQIKQFPINKKHFLKKGF
jgi:hypothetical protein